MRLISQFVTHFWSGCFGGYMGQQGGVFSLLSEFKKSEGSVCLLEECRVQSIECSLAEGEQGATTLLGLAPPTFVRILTSAFKSATAALAAWFGGRCALDMFRHHGFLYCAVDCRLKAFGVGAFCGDLCTKSIQRVRVDVYLVAVFQHQYIQYAENIYLRFGNVGSFTNALIFFNKQLSVAWFANARNLVAICRQKRINTALSQIGATPTIVIKYHNAPLFKFSKT